VNGFFNVWSKWISGGQVEEEVDAFQFFLLDFAQVAFGVEADLVLLDLAVQALLLPHAVRDLALQLGNVVLAVQQLLLQQPLLLRPLLPQHRHRLRALLLLLLGQQAHFSQRQFLHLHFLSQLRPPLLQGSVALPQRLDFALERPELQFALLLEVLDLLVVVVGGLVEVGLALVEALLEALVLRLEQSDLLVLLQKGCPELLLLLRPFLLLLASYRLQLVVAQQQVALLLSKLLLPLLVLLGQRTQLPHQVVVQQLRLLQLLRAHCLLRSQLAVQVGVRLLQLRHCPLQALVLALHLATLLPQHRRFL
jgi:hypothetical protein